MPALVGVLMGSDSDLPTVQHAIEALRELGIPYEVRVMSAHRTSNAVRAYAAQAERRGLRVLIAAAGGAAHLAGALASATTLPVIGIPVATSVGGLDALLSTVQMPKGIPVATVAIGPSGAGNAAILAAEILALGDGELALRLKEQRRKMAASTKKKDARVRLQLSKEAFSGGRKTRTRGPR